MSMAAEPPAGSKVIEIDPRSDLILKVCQESAGSPSDDEKKSKEVHSDQDESSSEEDSDEAESSSDAESRNQKCSANAIKPMDENQLSSSRWLRVSSKHLTLVSPVFEAMLNGNFVEGQLQLSSKNPPTLHLPEDHPVGMEVLCGIIHHHPSTIQEVALIDIMMEVAGLSDKYGCQSATACWYYWRLLHSKYMSEFMPVEELAKYIRASYLLNTGELFFRMTRAAIMYVPWEGTKGIKFCHALSDTLPDGFEKLLRKARSLQVDLLRSACQVLLGKLVPKEHSTDESSENSITPGDEKKTFPPFCLGQARRSARYVAALHTVGLWDPSTENAKLLPQQPVDSVLDLFRDVAHNYEEQYINDKCGQEHCHSCKQDLTQLIQEVASDFMANDIGLCLTGSSCDPNGSANPNFSHLRLHPAPPPI